MVGCRSARAGRLERGKSRGRFSNGCWVAAAKVNSERFGPQRARNVTPHPLQPGFARIQSHPRPAPHAFPPHCRTIHNPKVTE